MPQSHHMNPGGNAEDDGSAGSPLPAGGAGEGPSGVEYTDAELEWVRRAELLLHETSARGAGRANEATNSSTEDGRAWYDESSQRFWGELETIIVGATPHQLVNCLMDVEHSAHVTAFGTWQERSKLKRLGEVRQLLRADNHICIRSEVEMALGFPDVKFYNAVISKQVAEKPLTFIWVMAPITLSRWVALARESSQNNPAPLTAAPRLTRSLTVTRSMTRSLSKRSLSGQPEATRCCKLTAMADLDGKSVTKLQYIGWLELKQTLPEWFRLGVVVPDQLRLPHALQELFSGSFIATTMMDVALAAKPDHRAAAVAEYVMENALLRDCVFRHLGALLVTLVKGQRAINAVSLAHHYSATARRASARNLATITEDEAAAMGYQFQLILLTASSPADALDTFMVRYPFLREVDGFCPWFRPMMEVVAKRLMVNSRLGIGLRVAVSALLSLLDVGSDLYMVLSLLDAGRYPAAYGTLGLMSIALVLQLGVVWFQYKHLGRRTVIKEMLFAVMFLKPLVDAYRVAVGESGHALAPLSPTQELMVCRVCEMVGQAIPISILQLSTYLGMAEEERQLAALASILISCMATAFTSACMCYDFDTDPQRRKAHESFYGWVPSGGFGRLTAFALLIAFHAGVVLGKAFGMSLLGVTSWAWLAAVVGIEMFAFLFIKAVMHDFLYWPPGVGVGVSLLVRVIVKVCTERSFGMLSA